MQLSDCPVEHAVHEKMSGLKIEIVDLEFWNFSQLRDKTVNAHRIFLFPVLCEVVQSSP